FAPTRAHVERWRRWLAAQKIRVVPYHAGMGREERASAERAVRSGWCQIVVATSAFGMGMDFAGLEWMISTHAPPSLLALAQAAGRVARAGAEGTAVVLWHPTDFRIYDRGKGSDRRTAEMVSALRALESGPQPIEELNRYFS
ncbi:MAG TPA: helicase-related protein, partial [Bdellovibrionota bacterium]|nr:helicase-related protein [Bdellovibrionota bacterium]